MMEWKDCEKGFIREVEIDKERINSIVEKAMQRIELIKEIEVNEKTVSFIMENYYEVIKELLVAYLLRKGLKSGNHQCLISYFYKENPHYEFEANLISRMSFYRNRLCYYGETVPLNFYEKNKENIIKIIELIKKLI